MKNYINKINDIYEWNYDDENKVIEISNNKISGVVIELTIVVAENEESFDIYKTFTYADEDPIACYYETTLQELAFIEELYNLTDCYPEVEYSNYTGCPFEDELVGFFSLSFQDIELMKLIKHFELANKANRPTNTKFLSENYESHYTSLLQLEEENKDAINRIAKSRKLDGFAEHTSSKILDENDCVFLNERGTMLFGFALEAYGKIINVLKSKPIEVDDIYFGIKFTLAKQGNKIKAFDKRLVNLGIELIYESEVTADSDIKYFIGDTFLSFLCSEYWIIVLGIKGKNEKEILQERNELRRMSTEILSYLPEEYKYKDYDLSTISDTEFEDMCVELIMEMGFKNVLKRGNTNAPDGGVDIEADEEIQTILKTEYRHWIFQCKHMKAQLDRRDIAEIPILLKEFNASGYGVFYTNTFTPSTINRLKIIGLDYLEYWDKAQIENLLRMYNRVSIKYFGI